MGNQAAMNIQLPTHMDKATFLAWAEGREERYAGLEHVPFK